MCDFISFFTSVKKDKLICGDPMSHTNAPVHSGLDDWRECEWIDNKLTIRVTNGDDESAYRATILSKAKNRSELVKYFGGKGIDNEGNIFYFNEKGFHRTDGPAIVWANGAVAYFIEGRKVDPF